MRGRASGAWPPQFPGRARRAPIRLTLPEEVLLARRLLALGLGNLRGLRVTDNRSVMVSLSRNRVLSIHRGYAEAPDRVLRAVVRFVSRKATREVRRAAEHEILSFRAEEHVEGPPRRRRAPDRAQPGDLAKADRLARLFRHHNRRFFGGRLEELPIRVSGRMRTRLGQLCLLDDSGRPYEIAMSRTHIDRHGWSEAAHTLLHEMVHLWQHQNGHEVDHGARFRAKAEEVGVAASSRRAVGALKSRGRAALYD